jgi:hypothetical protein
VWLSIRPGRQGRVLVPYAEGAVNGLPQPKPYDRRMASMAPLAALAAVLALQSAPAETALHVFSPWAGSIPARGVTIDRTVAGSCTHGSEILTRFDAWHCSAGGHTYDPCFANTRAEVGAHVLCMASPWEDATAIELTRRLPLDLANPAGNPERFPPWAMVTASHQECELAPGSPGRVAGLRVNYVCAGSGVLLDLPKRGRTWTQAYAATTTAKTYRRVALQSVFF